MLVNIPYIKWPCSIIAQPIPTPIGFMQAYIMIIKEDIFSLIFAFLNAIPRVKPSAHLWPTIAKDKARVSTHYFWRPIAMPSNTA